LFPEVIALNTFFCISTKHYLYSCCNFVKFFDGLKLGMMLSISDSKLHSVIDCDFFRTWTSDDSFGLLYSSPFQGLQAGPFHIRRDVRRPTLVVVQSPEGYIFGGFSCIS
jgi:hypothetical protein